MAEQQRRGLTRPTDPARELAEIMRGEEQQQGEGRKEAAQEATFTGSREAMKLPSQEASHAGAQQYGQEDRQETSGVAAQLPAQEDWKAAVKAAAKQPAGEGRRARLNVDVPADIHLRVKLWCLKEGYQLNELVPALLAAFIEGEE